MRISLQQRSLWAEEKVSTNVWVRPSELVTQLFNEGVDPNDIIQGHIGDCWLMSAIGALAKFPKFIQEVTFGVITEESVTGKYEIYLWDCVDEDWVCVVIDDRIPVDAETKRPLFARPCGNELWVILLEKAFAKYSYNGWRSMNGGNLPVPYRCLLASVHIHVSTSVTTVNGLAKLPPQS